MAKRTEKEIQIDYKRIREYVDTNPGISSIKEIADGVKLTSAQVTKTLEKHPTVFSRIKKLLNKNKKATVKEGKEPSPDEYEEHSTDQSATIAEEENVKIFVIDASICGTHRMEEVVDEITSSGNKIVLTSITIRELDNLQRTDDRNGISASKLLSKAAGNSSFICKKINESVGIPDDCIINFCKGTDYTLITADKSMELKARMEGVKTLFLRHLNENLKKYKTQKLSNLHTLYSAKKIGDNLLISEFATPFRKISVFSEGKEYSDGIYNLHIGDDVYVATKKSEYMTFAHYRMLSLSAENNCTLIFSRRVYDVSDIANFPEPYLDFMNKLLK